MPPTSTMMDICQLPPTVGSCDDQFLKKFYFDFNTTKQCISFTYGGCSDNEFDNRFDTLSECQEACSQYILSSNTDTSESSSGDYHVAGFIMIFIVILIFCVLYYLNNFRSSNKGKYEEHQFKLVVINNGKTDKNKWNTPNCLYIDNISKQAIESDVKQLFMDYGKILQFEFKETRGDKLNICFIEYKSSDDAKRAMGELNGFIIPPTNGTKLVIKPGSEYNPNPNPSPISNPLTSTSNKKNEPITSDINGEERDKVSPELDKRSSYKARKKKERKGNKKKSRSRDSDSLRPKKKKILTEEERKAKKEKRLKERERRREERRIREKLSQEVAVKKESNANTEEKEDGQEEKEDDKKEEVDAVLVSDGDPLDVPDVDEAVAKVLNRVDTDIDAIMANKDSYIADNPLTPKKGGGDDDSSGSGSSDDSSDSESDEDDDDDDDDESDKNNKSSTKSMGAVDSDFEDYGDMNPMDNKKSIVEEQYNNGNLSDSNSIDFNNAEQINALKQFKMTMDGDNDDDIDADYDWNGNDDDKAKQDHDYVGVNTYED